MQIIGLLSFFDESRETLAKYVDGLKLAGVDRLVAADGRYAAFPSDQDVSPADQRGVLDAACRHYNIGLTMHVPSAPWQGGEVEKRTGLFKLALAVSEPDDWWLIADSDMVVTEVPADLRDRLAVTNAEAAMVSILDKPAERAKRADWPSQFRHRCLFRAQPLECRQNHYSYYNVVTGHPVWSGTDPRGLSEPLELETTIEHRPLDRVPARILSQGQYYARRDAQGLEMGLCSRCGKHQAVARVTVDLKLHDGPDGPNGKKMKIPAGGVNELCRECQRRQEKVNRRLLTQWGFDPAKTRFNERYALPARPEAGRLAARP